MATVHLFPIYTKVGRSILGKTVRRRHAGETEILEGLDRFLLALRCPLHAWSWPRSNKDERLAGYDAHQTCHKCTSRRMFDTREWQAGPIYRQPAEEPAREQYPWRIPFIPGTRRAY